MHDGSALFQIMLGANCLLTIFLVIVYFGQLFMTLTPPHWCSAPPDLLQLNLTQQQLKLLTVPRRHDASDDFHSCIRYDINLTQVIRRSFRTWLH